VLRSGSWRGLYVGDMASYAVHFMRTAWLTAYDVLPVENIATKERWQQWALAKGAWLFFEHDPYKPVARLVQRETRRELEPIELSVGSTSGLPTRRPPAE
jgi:hypothetical protein